MYKVFKSSVIVEGERYISYGITNNEDVCIEDISVDEIKVNKLAYLLSKEKTDKKYVMDFIEDFLTDLY